MILSRTVQCALALVLLLSVAGCGGGGGNSQEMELSGINTGDMLDGLLSRTFRALGEINSLQAAEAAVPTLQAINDDFDDLIYHLPKLSESGRIEMSNKAKRSLPEIQDMARRINDMPGLDKVLGSSMNDMVDKLTLLL